MPDALHSIRSLLCTSTNATLHELFFSGDRRSPNGKSLPAWLSRPGPVFLRNHVRSSKYDDVVEEVELLEANPMYANVRRKDGREQNVSLCDLAPCLSGSSQTMPACQILTGWLTKFLKSLNTRQISKRPVIRVRRIYRTQTKQVTALLKKMPWRMSPLYPDVPREAPAVYLLQDTATSFHFRG